MRALLTAGAFLLLTCCGSNRSEQGPLKDPPVPLFDGANAFQVLSAQVKLGPRVPGTSAHDVCLEYFSATLSGYADAMILQPFTHVHDRLGSVVLTNVVARFGPASTRRIMLTAHWDSRPWADAEPDPAKHAQAVPGANDGASGAAVLIEIARQLKLKPPPIGVDIVLFDGEDMGLSGNAATWCTGSRYFAQHLPPGPRPQFAVNIDMIGDRDLVIGREGRSEKFAPEVVDRIFRLAAELRLPQFVQETGDDVLDDHVPLNEAGIKAVDLIDFNYPNDTINFWHTTEDTPDKCSAESLSAVGTLLLHLIYVPATSQ